jgi:hypothetical protein
MTRESNCHDDGSSISREHAIVRQQNKRLHQALRDEHSIDRSGMMGRQSHHCRSMPAGYWPFLESARAKSDKYFIRVGLDVAKSRLDRNLPDAGRTEKDLIRPIS